MAVLETHCALTPAHVLTPVEPHSALTPCEYTSHVRNPCADNDVGPPCVQSDKETMLYNNDTMLYNNDTMLYNNDTVIYNNDTVMYNNDTHLNSESYNDTSGIPNAKVLAARAAQWGVPQLTEEDWGVLEMLWEENIGELEVLKNSPWQRGGVGR